MDFLKVTKISFYSLFATIFFVVGLYSFIETLDYWTPEFLDLKYDHLLQNAIPISIQLNRMLAYLCLILSIFVWILIFYNTLKIEDEKDKRILLFSIGIFTWILTPYIIYICVSKKYYQKYFKYISQNYTDQKAFSLKEPKNKILFFNSLFGIFVWMISLVGFLYIFLAKSNLDKENPQSNFFIGEMSFFTNLNNWLVFIFMSFYLFFNKKIIFKQNTLMIGLTAYIVVVCIIFWVLLFPYTAEGIEKNYRLSINGPTLLIKTIWVHAITPIFFTAYTINSFFLLKERTNTLLKTFGKLIIFPIIYGLYVFGLPFFSQFSVYGNVTNLNPGCIPFYDAIYNSDPPYIPGSPLRIFILLGLAVLFLLLIFIFWLIASKISKQNIKGNLI